MSAAVVVPEDRSVMRKYLESGRRVKWPAGEANKEGVYHFTKDFQPKELLSWERRLAKTGNAIIEQYRIVNQKQAELGSFEAFAVKELIRPLLHNEEIHNEVKAMTDLLHPHVVALLGTYSYRNRLNILIFPAGCCDLKGFMLNVSKRLRKQPCQPPEPKVKGGDIQIHHRYTWPFRESLEDQLNLLRRYFLCLCTAVEYLHRSHLRHKDLKPENIVIDLSGNVVIIDLGISTKFEPTASKATRDRFTKSTSQYMPPEMANDEERDVRSDIWSLGCVFLEMMAVLLGKGIEEWEEHCYQHYRGAASDNDYYLCSPQIESFLQSLKEKEPRSPYHGELTAALPKIKSMLNRKKEDRPQAEGLWKTFDFPSFADTKCKDCHPHYAGRWMPNSEQKQQAERGKTLRQKMEGEEERVGAIERLPNAGTRQRRSSHSKPSKIDSVLAYSRSSLHHPTRTLSPPRREASPRIEEQAQHIAEHMRSLRTNSSSSVYPLYRQSLPSPSLSDSSRPVSPNKDGRRISDASMKVHFKTDPINVYGNDTSISLPVLKFQASESDSNSPKSLSKLLPMHESDPRPLKSIHTRLPDSVPEVVPETDPNTLKPKEDGIPERVQDDTRVDTEDPPGNLPSLSPSSTSEASLDKIKEVDNQPESESPQNQTKSSGPSQRPTGSSTAPIGTIPRETSLRGAGARDLHEKEEQCDDWKQPDDDTYVIICRCCRNRPLKLLHSDFGILDPPFVGFEVPYGRYFDVHANDLLIGNLDLKDLTWSYRYGLFKRFLGFKHPQMIYFTKYEPQDTPTHILDLQNNNSKVKPLVQKK